nr:GGDEF domain-containing protein [uncultured Ruminococcus sp.]
MKLFSKDYIQQKKNELVADEEKWSQFRNACILIVFGFTSLLMSVVNFFTHQGSFTWITLGFSLACLIDLLLLRKKGAFAKAALAIFAVEITVVFIYFIITGIPEGFSVLWTAMVPCFGLLMYGIRTGTLLSLLMFLLLIFFFWMPIGNELLQYSYNATFKMRFPLLYLAFFVVAVLMEKMRGTAYAALKDSQKKYEFLCYHDALTGLYNRFWLQTIIAHPEKKQLKPAAIAVLDIDNFKFINDNFGHPNGDTVICRLGQTIVDTMNGSGELCRWGGDEFLILFHTDINAEGVCKRIVDAVRAQEFVFDSERVTTTVTVGLVIAPDGGTTDVDTMIRKADINLYHAKEKGKNCTITSQL